MGIEFQLSKKAYLNFQKLNLKDFIFQRIWIPILFIMLLFFPLSGDGHGLLRDLMALIIAPLIVFLIFGVIPFLIFWFRLNKIIANDKSLLEKKKITIIEDGLLIESESNTATRKWESITSARSIDGFIYLVLADKKYMPIPKSAFSSESEATNFIGLIQSKSPFSITRTVSKIQNFPISKKPKYSTGYFGLIPIVGAVIGIVFIANGISKYKDKWFILIGFGGIIFNACIFLFIFNYFDLGMKIQSGFVPFSQRQLNSVMKEVEFYKIENGVYPDSLEQLKNDNSEIWIYDPLQPGEEGNKSNKYNYQKVGDHYYLFSSGIDGIPNTKDDFYPQIVAKDSAKFGLIRK